MRNVKYTPQTVPFQQWPFIIDLYRQTNAKIHEILDSVGIEFIPVNGSYFCLDANAYSMPPLHPFELVYLVSPSKYITGAKELLSWNSSVEKSTFNKRKEIFFKNDYNAPLKIILQDHFKPCFLSRHIPFEELTTRAVNRKGCCITLTHEEASCMLLTSIIKYHGIHSIPIITKFLKPFGLSGSFSWERFWELCFKRYRIGNIILFSLETSKQSNHINRSGHKLPITLRIISKAGIITPTNAFPRALLTIVGGILTDAKIFRYLYSKFKTSIIHLLTYLQKKLLDPIGDRIAKKVALLHEIKTYDRLLLSQRSLLATKTIQSIFTNTFLVGTSSGIWFVKKDRIIQLTIGQTYGITHNRDVWYAVVSMGSYVKVVSFMILFENDSVRIQNLDTITTGLNTSVHQIDFYDNKLYIVDTYNDRLIEINFKKNNEKRFIHPLGISFPWTRHDRRHFNSVFLIGGSIYLLAHNGPMGPDYPSEIFRLDANSGKTLSKQKINALCGHNIIPKQNEFIFCNSKSGEVWRGATLFFKTDKWFLRGLCATPGGMVIGGSEIKPRNERFHSKTAIWEIDYKGSIQSTAQFDYLGQINEIRSFESPDFGLSQEYEKQQFEFLFDSREEPIPSSGNRP
ncbi:MAG: hypothetical protein JW795_08855 [Chitinivibrionales bacterium]|nr:hypothetical protein [Chitinivibrionales bacterium]